MRLIRKSNEHDIKKHRAWNMEDKKCLNGYVIDCIDYDKQDEAKIW